MTLAMRAAGGQARHDGWRVLATRVRLSGCRGSTGAWGVTLWGAESAAGTGHREWCGEWWRAGAEDAVGCGGATEGGGRGREGGDEEIFKKKKKKNKKN